MQLLLNTNYTTKNKNQIGKRLFINNHARRFMHKSGPIIRQVSLNVTKNSSCYYSTKASFRLKNHAAKCHANDESGKHSHVGTQYCIIEDCGSKKCLSLCDQPTDLKVEGHNTHKPPIGRFARFISDEDVNGAEKKQYFVKSNKENKMTEQEKQQYGKDYKSDSKTKQYVDNHSDKYDQ